MKRHLIVLVLVLGLNSASHAAPVLVEVSRILPVFASTGSLGTAAMSIGSTLRLSYSASIEKDELIADKMVRARNYQALSAVCHMTSTVFGIQSFRSTGKNIDLELQRRIIWALWGTTLSLMGSVSTAMANWEMIHAGGLSIVAGQGSSLLQVLPGAVAAIARIFA